MNNRALDGSFDVTVSGVFHNGRNDPVSSVEVYFSYQDGGSAVSESAFVLPNPIAIGGSETWSVVDQAQPGQGSSATVNSITYVDVSSGIGCSSGNQ